MARGLARVLLVMRLPIPAPAHGCAGHRATNRQPFDTASTLGDTRWLCAGKNPGTHLHPTSLMLRMNRFWIITRASRNTALLYLAPCPHPPL